MIDNATLDYLDELGFGANIEGLENYVRHLQIAAGDGEPLVDDSEYDIYYKMLKKVKPNSELLFKNWNVEENELSDYDLLLSQFPMMSINTVNDLSEVQEFKSAVGQYQSLYMFASSKINGHGTRIVYNYGKLVSASTRGGKKKGRDITYQLSKLVPNFIPDLEQFELVEIRGEVAIPLETFEKIRYSLNVKTPLSSITSILRESTTNEELSYVRFIAYSILSNELEFDTMHEKYKELENWGFEVPEHRLISDVTAEDVYELINGVVKIFENKYDTGMKYDTDGIVLSVDSVQVFKDLGKSNKGNYNRGNLALKMGRVWDSSIYCGTILRIEWKNGKKYKVPVAVIEPVKTFNGSVVTNVPLYNAGVMQRYKYYSGNDVYFKYGGESSVRTVDPDGNTVTI